MAKFNGILINIWKYKKNLLVSRPVLTLEVLDLNWWYVVWYWEHPLKNNIHTNIICDYLAVPANDKNKLNEWTIGK